MAARFLLRFLTTIVVAGVAIPALPAPPPSTPCKAPEFRQFDFWLGDWDVRNPAGKVVGRNRITAMHRGCVIAEQWAGNGGVTGSSFNVYDPDRKQWRQTWVDSTGGVLDLRGAVLDGRMTLSSARSDGKASGDVDRITWQRLPDGRVRQLWETSPDGGTTWETSFEGYYTRRK